MKFHSFNLTQKISTSIFFASCVITIFLNNPISGYTTELTPYRPYEERSRQESCSQAQKDALRASYEKARNNGVYNDWPKESTDKFIDSVVNSCSQYVTYTVEASGTPLPFSDWTSNNPVITWFGFVSNILQLIIAAGLLSGFVFWFFRPKSNDEQ